MESKIAHMQEQMEFWDEESSKMKERLQASSVRIDEQEKELRRLRKQATDLDGANEQANAARMEIESLQRNHLLQLEEMKKSKDKLQKELDMTDRARERTAQELEASKKRVEEAEETIRSLQAGQSGIEEMQAQINKLKDTVEKKEANIARSDKIIQKLMSELEELKGKS
mmetsp:Transcript_24065/g.78289  ORF Transcript_24065/g.78289 Transcript_24065/m.78289 type:complete len:170 (-) Transcript_24065:519-1028(-)